MGYSKSGTSFYCKCLFKKTNKKPSDNLTLQLEPAKEQTKLKVRKRRKVNKAKSRNK